MCVLGTRLGLVEGLKVEAWHILRAKGIRIHLDRYIKSGGTKTSGQGEAWAGQPQDGWDRKTSRKCALPSLRLQQDPII